MRLWSIHPKYLDRIGLVALWREALLAQKVLLGRTKGYRHHPQLERFKSSKDPIASVCRYLHEVAREGRRRGYNFKTSRICAAPKVKALIGVKRGQLAYEFEHLLKKLKGRDRGAFEKMRPPARIRPNPAFRAVPGGVEKWERIRCM